MNKVGNYVYATEDCPFSSIVNWVGKVVDFDLENRQYIVEYYFSEKPIRYSLQPQYVRKYNKLQFDLLKSVRISDSNIYGIIVSYDVKYQKYIIKFSDCLTCMSEEELLKYNNTDTNTQTKEENESIIQDAINKFKCRNFQEIEFKEDYILLNCSDYLIVIRIANSNKLYLTITSEDICIIIQFVKDKEGFKHKIIENKSINGENQIKCEYLDRFIYDIKTIDFKGQVVIDGFTIKVGAETGELVEIEC